MKICNYRNYWFVEFLLYIIEAIYREYYRMPCIFSCLKVHKEFLKKVEGQIPFLNKPSIPNMEEKYHGTS